MHTELADLAEKDLDSVVDLVKSALNEGEGAWAKRTLHGHFKCKKHDIDDGRIYFVYRVEAEVVAVAGLHHSTWGPPENVWLAWFAVAPAHQGQGIGGVMLDEVERRARKLRYTKLFVETYEGQDFTSARHFYEKNGFVRAGGIHDYLPEGEAMIVYVKYP